MEVRVLLAEVGRVTAESLLRGLRGLRRLSRLLRLGRIKVSGQAMLYVLLMRGTYCEYSSILTAR